MDLMFSAAIVSLFVIAAAAAWPAMYAMFSRADTRELNFRRVAQHRGLTDEDLAASKPDVARAMYRCIACNKAARCDERVAAGRFDEIDDFCPNRSLLDHLAAESIARR